jgi:D-xylose transport system permease protein
VAVGVYALALLAHRHRRTQAGLEASSVRRIVVLVTLAGIGLFGTAAILTSNRGVPLSLLILLAVVLAADLLVRKTVFGRHILACGGNLEAARLTGVRVDRVRIAVFVLGSTLAAAGGMLAAGRLLTVSSGSGGGDLLLNAIAAAVIGGTSLFGGRGSAWAAVLGALVIGAISNGMDLLSVQAATKFSVTGAVLFAAVAVDSIARERARQKAGL